MKTTAACIALALVCCLVACGDKAPAITVDDAPFRAAIVDYLKDKHMDMKIKEFKSIKPSGDTATATCTLVQESDMHAVSIRWRFEFSRKGEGKWRVDKYEQVKK